MFEINILPIKEALPNLIDQSGYFTQPNYMDLFQGLNAEIILTKTFGSYQGDYLYIFRADEGNRYGFLNFSYGSCSGCDSLQGCQSYEDVDQLRTNLINNINWLSPVELIKYLKGKDWETTVSDCSPGESKGFINDAMKLILTPDEFRTLDVIES